MDLKLGALRPYSPGGLVGISENVTRGHFS